MINIALTFNILLHLDFCFQTQHFENGKMIENSPFWWMQLSKCLPTLSPEDVHRFSFCILVFFCGREKVDKYRNCNPEV
jgi:hypothetical protein